MQSVTLLRMWMLGMVFGGALGCGGDSGFTDGGVSDSGGSSILVTLAPLPARATQVVISSSLDNKPATNMQPLVPPTDTFAVELPSTQRGHLVLSAVAYDSDNCTQGSSSAAVDLPAVRTTLPMPLMARSPRKCGSLDPCAANTLCGAKPVAQTIYSVWTLSPTDIWAVGLAATLAHYNGTSWTVVPPPAGVSENFFGVWGNAANNVWAVGSLGRIIHYDGAAWTTIPSSITQTLYGVWGVSNTEIWAVGNPASLGAQGTVLHYNGSSWAPIVNAGIGTKQLNAVWADSPAFIYACGVGGFLTRYDGASWDPITSGTTVNLHSIWGTPGGVTRSAIFATGDNGVILRIRYAYDPNWFALTSTGTTNLLYGIHGDGASVIYAVGTGGTIVRSDSPFDSFVAQNSTTLGTLFSVHVGSSSGTSNGLVWTGGISGFLGYVDQRP